MLKKRWVFSRLSQRYKTVVAAFPLPTMKYLVVTGGTISGLGKGTAISSIGVVLKSHGLRVTAIKIDPYLNIDAGTMSPFEHGEVYVLEDGSEVDLDLGNYERFLGITLTNRHSVTSGKVYQKVIQREREGYYLGKTVQMVPHVTDAIQEWISETALIPVDESKEIPQVCLIELGGTVGDIECAVYLEALQQFCFKVGASNCCIAHLGMVPLLSTGELKTKPCQHSVKELRQAGLKPDFILCRSDEPVDESTKKKLSLFCQVPPDLVFSLHHIENLLNVPLLLYEQDIGPVICRRLGLEDFETRIVPVLVQAKDLIAALPREALPETGSAERLSDWRIMARFAETASEEIVIAVVGKYTGFTDSYKSIVKALKHATMEAGLKPTIQWIESSLLEQPELEKGAEAWTRLKAAHGVLVPGGFGDRGIEGKILAANFCRISKRPYLGICVGLQTAVIEFARNVLGWENANSQEFDEATPHPVVVFMPETASEKNMGGTMRLGARDTFIKDPKSMASRLYGGKPVISERHRHRYEVNPALVPQLQAAGLRFSGQDDQGQRMEICELPDHPFFFGVQYHPEFRSRLAAPAPAFLGLILASSGKLEKRLEADGGVLKAGAGFHRP